MKIDIADSVIESADNLIGLGLTQCERQLLELVICKWVEQFIEDLPCDIDHYFHHNSNLNQLIFQAEKESEQLVLCNLQSSDDNQQIDCSSVLAS